MDVKRNLYQYLVTYSQLEEELLRLENKALVRRSITWCSSVPRRVSFCFKDVPENATEGSAGTEGDAKCESSTGSGTGVPPTVPGVRLAPLLHRLVTSMSIYCLDRGACHRATEPRG